MKRLLFLTAAGLTVVALAGAVGLPDLAGAQDATTTDSITVNGVGTVDAVPNEAKTLGAETRRDTAQAAVAANGDAMRRILNALRQAGGAGSTQWVSVYPYTDETGQVNGYVASNSVSAVSDVGDAPALIDAATEAAPTRSTGLASARRTPRRSTGRRSRRPSPTPGLNAEALAKASGRSLGAITTIVEAGAISPEPLYREATKAAADSATPVVPGQQETSATVSVTFSLR